MPKIILIETSTSLCSTAISIDGRIASHRESTSPKAHASQTAPFIKEMLDECGLTAADCDAVCVSAGPGSYTGLRVGSSTAKGLCFGAGIPLISVGTLELLASQALGSGMVPEGCRHIIPMIDARRMEVYAADFAVVDEEAVRRDEVRPVIVDADSFASQLEEGPVLFIGDGAAKCAPVLTHSNASFVQTNPVASAMMPLAEKAWNEKRFENTAYFEPFYLKEFVATVSRKKLF